MRLRHSILQVFKQILLNESNIALRASVRNSIRHVKKMFQVYSSDDRKNLINKMRRQSKMIQTPKIRSKFLHVIEALETSESSSSESDDNEIEEEEEDNDEENERFKVHQITGFRLKGPSNSRMYLVRWKGYESEDDTWEPVHRLMEDGCGDLIAQFHREHMRFH